MEGNRGQPDLRYHWQRSCAHEVLGLYLERPRAKVGPWAALVGASDTAT
jgi:hypothetical protein